MTVQRQYETIKEQIKNDEALFDLLEQIDDLMSDRIVNFGKNKDGDGEFVLPYGAPPSLPKAEWKQTF